MAVLAKLEGKPVAVLMKSGYLLFRSIPNLPFPLYVDVNQDYEELYVDEALFIAYLEPQSNREIVINGGIGCKRCPLRHEKELKACEPGNPVCVANFQDWTVEKKLAELGKYYHIIRSGEPGFLDAACYEALTQDPDGDEAKRIRSADFPEGITE